MSTDDSIPLEWLHFLHERQEQMWGVAGEETLKPERRVQIDGEQGERGDRVFHHRFHRIDVLQDCHLEEADFLAHEARMMNWWAITNPHLGDESSAELLD